MESDDTNDRILSGHPYLLREEAQDCIIRHNKAPTKAALQNLFIFFISRMILFKIVIGTLLQ